MRSVVIGILLSWGMLLYAQSPVYYTQPIEGEVHSLKVHVEGDAMSLPTIALNGEERIEISFDLLSHQARQLAYEVFHLNANHTRSVLSPLEYLDGFNYNEITDYELSTNTFIPYTNYRLVLPNEQTRFTASGNYAVRIYDRDAPEKTLLYATFGLYEPLVTVLPRVSGVTDIDYNRAHQQIDFSLTYPLLRDISPQNDLTCVVRQNNRRDNAVAVKNPQPYSAQSARFEHNRSLIFEAGNEYRRFEMPSVRYAGIGVDRVVYVAPCYRVLLQRDTPRNQKSYNFDRTQYGQYLVRLSGSDNSETESDYVEVTFTLEGIPPLLDGDIFIQGEMTHHLFDPKYRMRYNVEEKRYEASLLLKQGAYNYQYLLLPYTEKQATTANVEGNFYQTRNMYTFEVYLRRPTDRYDRLVGYKLHIEP